ncbi:pectate lyase [Candidatus Sulfidibacterium hydrothermale]|uniref:pectate lyase n=1 Tax=Candidatus Sulfidibacterium hydrothermale TaxID=2875962 RepID=UPI001F0A7345|nr:pectate lyase [Candidatus Sulfidibacterium hydrothermale]UBM62452.1 pectate lyase [Candidatus Sulfidibacterium hydrothermale]
MDTLINLILFENFEKLKNFIEKENFKGWDPYDGLNSKLFQVLPFKHSALFRLVQIQAFKRNPVNLRKVFLIPKEYNPKALGLFLTAYSNLYFIDKKTEYLDKLLFFRDKLNELKSSGYSGSCWGYNFDWQARRLFLFPRYTPTVVATTFVAYGLMDAYEVTKDYSFLELALSSAEFVKNDLHKTPKKEGFLFSYSPLRGNDTVYNASLLGSKLLARIYYYTKKEEYKELARQSILACVHAQNNDGSWVYGELPTQNWIDSFHTGYNLEAICEYQNYTDSKEFDDAINKGINFYLNNFFLRDGTPKYYHDKVYPVDIHSPAQFVVTMYKLGLFNQHKILIDKVLSWTIRNMQDKKGYFYYQLKQGLSSKIPYMRWSQAWMMYALSFYLLANKNETGFHK